MQCYSNRCILAGLEKFRPSLRLCFLPYLVSCAFAAGGVAEVVETIIILTMAAEIYFFKDIPIASGIV